MSEDPTTNWPDDIKKSYENMKIPSLYEAVVMNEKLTIELKNQSREMKSITENLGQLSAKFDAMVDLIGGEWEEFREVPGAGGAESPHNGFIERTSGERWPQMQIDLLNEREVFLVEEMEDLLIESTDAILELCSQSKEVTHQVIAMLPQKTGLWSQTPHWYPLAEEMIRSFHDKVNQVRYRFIARLEERDIHLIEPQIGDTHDPEKHQVLEKVQGAEPGSVAKLIRVGYMVNTQVLRRADIILYA